MEHFGMRDRRRLGGARWRGSRPGGLRPCDRVVAELGALLDRELDPEVIETVEAHLSICPDCSAERAAIESLQGLVVRSIERVSPDPTPFELLLARLEAGGPDSMADPRRAVRRPSGERPSAIHRHDRSRRSMGASRIPLRRRPGRIWFMGAGAVASLAMLVAFALLPMTQRWPGWLDAPGSPRATALTLTSRDPGRARVAKVAHGTGRPATRGAVSRESLAKADPSRDLDVPEDLRRNPGLFIDMPLVRRLEKLRHLEAVYRQDGMGGGGAG